MRSPSIIVIMEELSREYGWTPSQIRMERCDDIYNYLQIIKTRRKIDKENNHKKYGRK